MRITDLEVKRWRAEFEEWLLPHDHTATRLAFNPKGPFTVEVFLDTSRDRELWRAELIPTRLKLGSKGFKTANEVKGFVVEQFSRMTTPWHEI